MPRIATCLWFNGKAEEAMNFYASVFPGAEITDVMRGTEATPGETGSVLAVTLRLDDYEIIALDGGPQFSFTPAISLFVKCDNQQEVDTYWEKLLAGGQAMQCGWLTDRYGVTWQIIPAELMRMLNDPDRNRSNRVMRAMMGMVRLDIAGLRRAYDPA
jgi:predicted 3-demethylubiquinone-9 3-methyltransferase (glyoxalase superfamily)